MDVLAEAFGFIAPEQLESSAVTAVLTEVPTSDAGTASDYESIDDYVGNDEFDDGPFIEIYPESHLVYLEPKTKRSKEVKEKIYNLINMKSVDDAFKTKLHYNKVFKHNFVWIHTCMISLESLTTDASKMILQEIESALVHRLLFAVRQRRLVTKLENKGLLANSETAWYNATFELNLTSKIVRCWHTKRLLPLSKALLTELNCGMKDDDFDSGARRLLTQELNRELFWKWLSEKGIVSRCSAIVRAYYASDYESDDEEEEEEDDDEEEEEEDDEEEEEEEV
jgi:hypothetical protein